MEVRSLKIVAEDGKSGPGPWELMRLVKDSRCHGKHKEQPRAATVVRVVVHWPNLPVDILSVAHSGNRHRSRFYFCHISALTLWEHDHSLTIALDVCKAFLEPIQFLTSIYPGPRTYHVSGPSPLSDQLSATNSTP